MSLKRITKEEAEEFISVEEDFTNSTPLYFTLTPSSDTVYPSEEGWEDVTYYTNRSKTLKFEPGAGKQYVYILTNDTMPGLVKIGYTKNDPSKRAQQKVHTYLDSFRLNKNREFFKMTVEEAKSVIERLGKRYNI